MNIDTDIRVSRELSKLSKADRSKISEYIDLFRIYGFGLSQQYLKKVDKHVWELRPDRWRLFVLLVSPNCIIIHLMLKQSQKMTKKTKQIIKQRSKEYGL